MIASRKTEELLSRHVSSASRGKVAAPLKEVSYDIEIVSGLAQVTQRRVFRNDEDFPIEATMTFPVGYDSVVGSVKATVGGRTMVGVSKARKEARAVYEKALDDGKATVLHEELLRGLHMLSVGNVAPGADIVVEATFVSPLSLVGETARLRVPLTIGAIYGNSPFIESDDIAVGGTAMDAKVTVSGVDGILLNGRAVDGAATVSTSAVIDLVVPSPALVPLKARMPSGNWAGVSFSRPKAWARPIDAELLLDTSGSMRERATGALTKWQALQGGLVAGLSRAEAGDVFRFWTFSNTCIMRSSATGISAAAAVASVPFDDGGTELALAVHKVATSRAEANVLLVTDGKSHREIDFDIVRKSGARFTVVLIGRASFESRVAQLAAITGGQLFVVDPSDDVASVVAAALLSMRSVASPVVGINEAEETVSRTIGGLSVSVSYGNEPGNAIEAKGVVSFAAGLAVAALPADKAGAHAEACGIVSHLTSLVMVDEEGSQVDGIAVTRKVALAESDELAFHGSSATQAFYAAAPSSFGAMRSFGGGAGSLDLQQMDMANDAVSIGGWVSTGSAGDVHEPPSAWVDAHEPPSAWVDARRKSATSKIGRGFHSRARVSRRVTETVETFELTTPLGEGIVFGRPGLDGLSWSGFDWSGFAQAVNGKNSSGGNVFLVLANVVSTRTAVRALATAIGCDVLHVAMALLARVNGAGDRTAERIVRKVLSKAPASLLDAALAQTRT